MLELDCKLVLQELTGEFVLIVNSGGFGFFVSFAALITLTSSDFDLRCTIAQRDGCEDAGASFFSSGLCAESGGHV